MTRNKNLILNTDSYKQSHYSQYPAGSKFVSSYIESRGGRWKDSVFFGLQMFIKEYLTKPITQADIDEAEAVCAAHFVPFNREGWQYILDEHNGILPVSIEALPEGTVLPVKNALVQVHNTDPNVPWLTSFLETAILRAVWYPTTVATLSYQIRRKVYEAVKESCDDPNTKMPFMLNDFGARGVSSYESAEIGGLAHLASFAGTDNMVALLAARDYYNVDLSKDMPGFSVPAAEHSTVTSWGRDHEADMYENMLKQYGGKFPLISVVSDSYDIYSACRNIWGDKLKEKVEKCGSTVVVRPDSGDPVTVVCDIIAILMEQFGHTVNSKGYKVLPQCVRVIQGDGINEDSIMDIVNAMLDKGFSIENIVFGMGGGLLQQLDRDTMKFAMKCSSIQVNDELRDVYKDPITDKGKISKKGILAVVDEDGVLTTIRKSELNGRENKLEVVYENGVVLVNEHFNTIRDRINKTFA